MVVLEALLMALFTATTLLSSTAEGWEKRGENAGSEQLGRKESSHWAPYVTSRET